MVILYMFLLGAVELTGYRTPHDAWLIPLLGGWALLFDAVIIGSLIRSSLR